MKKLIILFLAVMALTANSYGQSSPSTAITLYPTDTIIPLPTNDTIVWYTYQTTSAYLKLLLHSPDFIDRSSPLTQMPEIHLYSGTYNNLTEITDADASPTTFLNTNLGFPNTYYIKVKYKTEWNPILYIINKSINDTLLPCTHDNCNLIGNGYFNSSQVGSACYWNPFIYSSVPCWCAAWGSPIIEGGGTGIIGNFAYLACGMQENYLPDSNLFYGSEAIYQNINIESNRTYNLSFKYKRQHVTSTASYAKIHVLITSDNFGCLGVVDFFGNTYSPLERIPTINNIVWASAPIDFTNSTVQTFSQNITMPVLPAGQYKLLFYVKYDGPYYDAVKRVAFIGEVKLIPEQPSVAITHSNSTTVCRNTPVTLTANAAPLSIYGNFTYLWSNGATTQSITVSPSASTTYTCTVTDAYGCTVAGSYTVPVCAVTTPIITGDSSACMGTTITYTTQTGKTNYLWAISSGGSIIAGGTSNDNSITITWNTAGAQIVTVRYSECGSCPTRTTVFNVTVKPTPIVDAGNESTYCLANITAMGGVAIGGSPTASGAPTPFTYNWTDQNGNFISNASNPVVSPTVTTTYTVVATSSNGCSASDNVTITLAELPTPIITGNNNNCDLTTTYTVANPVANSTYNWAITNGTIVSGQNTLNVTVTWNNPIDNFNPGMLTVVATDQNGCTNSNSINIYDCCYRGGSPILHDQVIDDPVQIPADSLFVIDGSVTFDCDVTLNNRTIKFGPYAKIIVAPGRTFTVDNASVLQEGCEFMWDGIYVSDPTTEVKVLSNSTVRNAINGIVASNNAKLTIIGANFNYNLTSVSINNYVPQTGIVNIKANNFLGNGLVPPYTGAFSMYGIKLYNANDITIGDITAATQNTFDDLICGIYSRDSYTKIYANNFTNIQGYLPNMYPANPMRVNKPTAIYSCHSLSGSVAPKIVEIGGSGNLANSFDNCQNGIGVYNEIAKITGNNIKAIDYGINIKDPLNSTVISNNIIGQCSNSSYPLVGMQIKKTQAASLNLTIKDNTISAREKGIYIGNCKSSRKGDSKKYTVDITNNSIQMYDVDNAKTGILTENCLAIFVKCNIIQRMTAALPPSNTAMLMHGISVNQTQKAEIQENTILHMGAGINVYGCADLTKFNCNLLNADYYGFLFNQQASITAQGDDNLRTDNQFMPANQYSGIYNGYPTERKFWAINDNLSSDIRWFVHDNSYLLDPQNFYPNPTSNKIFVYLTSPDANSSCTMGCMPAPDEAMTIEEREAMFGAIVRDELKYENYEEQYKAYNRYVLYQAISENNNLMYLGGEDDYMYQDFYANEGNGSIGAFDELETLIAEGDINQAEVKNNLIQDPSLIANNQKIVNSIYLSTFARDKYELTDEQYQTLLSIATGYTPWEGGEGVYIARYMLDIDVDMSNPNVQYNKRPGKAETGEMLTTFPNPVADNLTLSFNKAIESGFVINVYNYAGVCVLTETVSQTQAQHQLNTAKLTNGIYFMTVKTNTETFKAKFTVIK